jgi:hypothetical protein
VIAGVFGHRARFSEKIGVGLEVIVGVKGFIRLGAKTNKTKLL